PADFSGRPGESRLSWFLDDDPIEKPRTYDSARLTDRIGKRADRKQDKATGKPRRATASAAKTGTLCALLSRNDRAAQRPPACRARHRGRISEGPPYAE